MRTMVSEAELNVGGRRLRYLEAGGGRPAVLLHAFPLTADMWRPQLERVPDGWRFIAPDLGGLGSTSPLPSVGTMEAFAGDIIALLDALGIERAAIGGVSMGGYITFALYRTAPERFTALLLANTRAQADTPEGRDARIKMRQLVAD